MAKPETDRNKIVSRLKSEGWCVEGGAKHDKLLTRSGPASRSWFLATIH
ncbi:hypothetical protein [Rhodoblastus sp.]